MCEFVDDLASISAQRAAGVRGRQLGSLRRLSCTGPAPFGWRECRSVDPAGKVRETATAPDAWWWHRQPCQAVLAFLSVTSRRRMDFRAQADAIEKLTERYNVTYIGIDSTGVGHGVTGSVKRSFLHPGVCCYNPNVKNALVLKAYDIISHRRLS
ncbi:phage terminase large subunit family protein [Escherichia coli]